MLDTRGPTICSASLYSNSEKTVEQSRAEGWMLLILSLLTSTDWTLVSVSSCHNVWNLISLMTFLCFPLLKTAASNFILWNIVLTVVLYLFTYVTMQSIFLVGNYSSSCVDLVPDFFSPSPNIHQYSRQPQDRSSAPVHPSLSSEKVMFQNNKFPGSNS